METGIFLYNGPTKKTTKRVLQGHSQHPSENNGLLLPKYESERLPEPTGGSPDVVHLIKYASLVFRWLPMVYTVQEAKETDV